MDGQQYLNQLSADIRPEKKSRGGKLLSSKFVLVGLIGLIALVVIIVIGALINGGKGGEKNLSYALKLHLSNTAEVVQGYRPALKSSDLRSNNVSLYGILSTTDNDLTEYLVEVYKFKDNDINKNLVEEATLARDGLEADLFEAKISGTLDRTFAHKMTHEISLIMEEEAKLINTTKNEVLRGVLTKSYDSLKNLYNNFNSFSEAK